MSLWCRVTGKRVMVTGKRDLGVKTSPTAFRNCLDIAIQNELVLRRIDV